MYSPTMSRTCSMSSGSFHRLNASLRVGEHSTAGLVLLQRLARLAQLGEEPDDSDVRIFGKRIDLNARPGVHCSTRSCGRWRVG